MQDGQDSTTNLASRTSSLSSNPQLNEHAPELTFTFRNRRFQKMNTFWGIIFLMLLYVVFLALILPLHWYCSNQRCAQSAFSVAVYSNAGVWFVTIALTFLVRLEFEKVRRRGYASFYKRNCSFVSDPFVVFSIGNAILLVYTWILHDSNVFTPAFIPFVPTLQRVAISPDNGFDKAGYFVGFQIVISLEVIISFIFLLVLTAQIIKFNGLAQPPDAINDRILSRTIEPRSIVGYNETSNSHDLIVDRQTDGVNFLKRRCRLLYGSVRTLLSSVPADQRRQLEEHLRQYLDRHRDDDDAEEATAGVVDEVGEYLGSGSVVTGGGETAADDDPLIAA